jgi:hypothetical protein
VEIVRDMEATKWMKLVSNATTLVPTATLGISMVDAANVPQMRDLMLRAGQEALDATLALGNPILPIFGLGADEVARPKAVVETLLDTLLAGFVLPGLHGLPGRALPGPAPLCKARLPQPHVFQRGREGRSLRRLGRAGALRDRDARRVPVTTLIGVRGRRARTVRAARGLRPSELEIPPARTTVLIRWRQQRLTGSHAASERSRRRGRPTCR